MYVRRKVFSYSEPEEQLYSVTMTEEEYDLFSDFMESYYSDAFLAASKTQEEGFRAARKAGFKGTFNQWLKKNGLEMATEKGGQAALNDVERKAAELAVAEQKALDSTKKAYQSGTPMTVAEKIRNGKIAVGSQARAIAKHVKNHKVGYGVGAAGLAAAGAGAYALGRNSK